MTKAYTYGGPGIGEHDTRHEAVGVAAVEIRETHGRHGLGLVRPGNAAGYVMAIPTARCGYCGEAFDYEEELAEHKPCPAWENDKPVPPEGGHNPIEAARMTRYGL